MTSELKLPIPCAECSLVLVLLIHWQLVIPIPQVQLGEHPSPIQALQKIIYSR